MTLTCLALHVTHATLAWLHLPCSHDIALRQVKLRGFRIELGEVESAMADVPGVALAVALVLTSTSGSQQLVGYVTPETVDPAAVMAALRARLPAHFVPLLIIPLASMPLLPNEKIDRKALASAEYAPNWSAAAAADEYVAPRSELEARGGRGVAGGAGPGAGERGERLLPHRRQLHHGQQGDLAPARRAGRCRCRAARCSSTPLSPAWPGTCPSWA